MISQLGKRLRFICRDIASEYHIRIAIWNSGQKTEGFKPTPESSLKISVPKHMRQCVSEVQNTPLNAFFIFLPALDFLTMCFFKSLQATSSVAKRDSTIDSSLRAVMD